MSLKILHVGNIAQNAYVNASILRARGHDCDLVAFDDYHCADSPEWYELIKADVELDRLGPDQFFPDFYALGPAMPHVGDWVAQGPFLPALLCLILRRKRHPLAQTALSALSYMRFKSTVLRTMAPFSVRLSQEDFEAHLARYDLPPRLRRRIRFGNAVERSWNWIIDRVLIQEDSPYVRRWNPPLPVGTLEPYFEKDPTLKGFVSGLRASGLTQALGIEFDGPYMQYDHLERHGFSVEEVSAYCWAGRVLRELVSFYDVSIFYGDSSKFAFAAGIETYCALEHGTVRTLPFEPNVNGRLVAAAYRKAKRVFITNTDYATAKPRLEFAPEQRVYFPHPFDEAKSFEFRLKHSRRRNPEKAVFLCPARQDWRSGDPTWGKANDKYFRAGRLLLDRGRTDFMFRCVDWGVDREHSRTLVTQLGLSHHVQWSPMLPKGELWAAMMDAHAVMDQFLLSAFGGSTVEAFALGCRVISRDDGLNNAVFFNPPPPIIAAATIDEIATRMQAVMDDPEDLAKVGEAGVSWIKLAHSADRIHDLQMNAFGYLPNTAPEPSNNLHS